MPLTDATVEHLLFAGLDEEFRRATEMRVVELAREFGTTSRKATLEAYTRTNLAPLCFKAWLYLGIAARLPDELLLVPSRRVAVCVLEIENTSVLVAHSGFFEILGFAHALDVLERFVVHSPLFTEDTKRSLSMTLSQIKYTVIWHGMRNPFLEIPRLEVGFPPSLENPWSREMMAMWSFVFAHEIAHLELHGAGAALGYGDHLHPHLLLEEPLHFVQRQEFEADEFALMSVKEHESEARIGVIKFLDFFGVLESWFGRYGHEHPYAVNRLAHLRPLLARDASVEESLDRTARSLAHLYTFTKPDMAAYVSAYDAAAVLALVKSLVPDLYEMASKEGPSYLPPYYPAGDDSTTASSDQSDESARESARARARVAHLTAFRNSTIFARIGGLQKEIGLVRESGELASLRDSLDLSAENEFSPITELYYLLSAEELFVEIVNLGRMSDMACALERIRQYAEVRRQLTEDPTFWLEYQLLSGMHAFQNRDIAQAEAHLREFDTVTKPFRIPVDADYVKRMRRHIASGELEPAREILTARMAMFFPQHFAEVTATLNTKIAMMSELSGNATRGRTSREA
jgi:hypothetical protein